MIIEDAIKNSKYSLYINSNEIVNALIDGMLSVVDDQDNQYKHMMLNSSDIIDSKEKAFKKANEKLEDFKNKNSSKFFSSSDWFALGQNLHPISDGSAPSHSDWAIWFPFGTLNPLNWLHLFGDLKLFAQGAYENTVESVTDELDCMIEDYQNINGFNLW